MCTFYLYCMCISNIMNTVLPLLAQILWPLWILQPHFFLTFLNQRLSLWFLYIYNLSTGNLYSTSTIAVSKVYLLLAFINLPTSNFYSLSTKSLNKFSTSNHYNLLTRDFCRQCIHNH